MDRITRKKYSTKIAPMGDPIELFLRSYVLTIRKDDAAKIELQEEFNV